MASTIKCEGAWNAACRHRRLDFHTSYSHLQTMLRQQDANLSHYTGRTSSSWASTHLMMCRANVSQLFSMVHNTFQHELWKMPSSSHEVTQT